MRIDPAGLPYVATPALAALGAAAAGWVGPALFGAGLAGVFAFFFRDPDRHPPSRSGIVLAPADGRVLVAGPAVKAIAPPGEWQQVSIFLSPLDVHVNRVPVSGRVVRVQPIAGRKGPAYTADAARANARTEIWFDTEWGPVVCRQVAGILARRVVCRIAPGMSVRAGDRFGIMKFGSRIDLFLPLAAELAVAPGARVRAAETVVAYLASVALSTKEVPGGGT